MKAKLSDFAAGLVAIGFYQLGFSAEQVNAAFRDFKRDVAMIDRRRARRIRRREGRGVRTRWT